MRRVSRGAVFWGSALVTAGLLILAVQQGLIDESLVPAVHMLIFGDGDAVRIAATPDSHARFMLMAGAPFNEPIFPYGPFVMNTRDEIIQAFEELRNGTFIKT